jgi:hypothetical protein
MNTHRRLTLSLFAIIALAILLTLGNTMDGVAGSPMGYAQLVLQAKPVGYWRLGESKGPAALDISGKGHHGVYHGTPLFGQLGALKGDRDTAIAFQGKGSFVEIPAHADFSQPTSGKGLTVEVWVRPDMLEFKGENADGYVHWLGRGAPGKHEWALRFYSRDSKRPNRISAYIFNPEGGLGAGAYFEDKLTAGEWLHVVACFDPGDADAKGKPGVHIYKNGVQRQGPPSAGALYNNPKWKIKPVIGTAPLRLGTRDSKGFLIGGLDEVAIYPRVLSAAEILAHYDAGRKP